MQALGVQEEEENEENNMKPFLSTLSVFCFCFLLNMVVKTTIGRDGYCTLVEGGD